MRWREHSILFHGQKFPSWAHLNSNSKPLIESHWLTCYFIDQSLFLVQSVLQLVSMLSMPPLPFLKYKFVLELSWKQVSKDRVWRDLIIESRSENDFRLHKKIFGWWFWVKNYFESSLQSSSEVLFWFVSSVVVELDGSELDEVEFEGPASGIEFVRPTSSSIVVRHTTDTS